MVGRTIDLGPGGTRRAAWILGRVCRGWKPGGFAYVANVEAWCDGPMCRAEVEVKTPGRPDRLVIGTQVDESLLREPAARGLIHMTLQDAYDHRINREAAIA